VKAAVLEAPRQLKVENVPKPVPKQDEVVIKVKACGICGSDLRYLQGENPWALHTLGEDRPNPPNIILGHEFAGEVVQSGDNANSYLIGKRVVVSPYRACGVCRFCRKGTYNLCHQTIHLGHGAGWGEMEYYPGGMAEYCQVWADKVFLLPDSVSFEEAALLDIVGIAVHGMNVSRIAPGSDVAILGTGPLGLSMVQIARIWGARKVFCTDIREKNLNMALETGADDAINAQANDPVQRIMGATDSCGVDVVLDTVGSPETLQQALRLLAPSGTLVNMATHANNISFDLTQLGSERAMRSSSNYFFHEFQTCLDLAAAGQLNLKPMITHRFGLQQVEQAFEMLLAEAEHDALKVIIEPCSTGTPY